MRAVGWGALLLAMNGTLAGCGIDLPARDGPRVVYLMYADGQASPAGPAPCRGTPPAFACAFAPTLEECQQQVQSYLDRWYADFDVVFTFAAPSRGPFYSVVISSGGGAWCDYHDPTAGIAPFTCGDQDGGVAYVFKGGLEAKETAIAIAQEQAHLVGLEHTAAESDTMDATFCTSCDGFQDAENTVTDDRCDRPMQNSYRLMEQRLGIWPGGSKPAP